MSIGSTESSHPSLSHADGLAASTADAFLLVGRVLLGWLFLASSAGIGGKLWNPAGFAGYLKVLGAPAPEESCGVRAGGSGTRLWPARWRGAPAGGRDPAARPGS